MPEDLRAVNEETRTDPPDRKGGLASSCRAGTNSFCNIIKPSRLLRAKEFCHRNWLDIAGTSDESILKPTA